MSKIYLKIAFPLIAALVYVFFVMPFMKRTLATQKARNDTLATELATYPTKRYWQQVGEILQPVTAWRVQFFGGDFSKTHQNDRTYEAYVDLNHKGTQVFYLASQHITTLSVLDVDPEASTHAGQLTELLGEWSSFYTDMRNLLSEADARRVEEDSFSAGAQAFLRGALGDGAAAYREWKDIHRKWDERRTALRGRESALVAKEAKLNSNEILVRATLSKRYNREFVKLQ